MVLLIDIDSTIPNLALHKIAKYHQDKGDEVVWDFPLLASQAEKVYVSCIFTKNKSQCKQWEGIAEIGGTGYDLNAVLPDEIENIKPRMNYGFTTRGCIRKCKFCFVPEKEGAINIVGDLYDLWDGKSGEVTVMDNNILGLPEHFKMICRQAKDKNISVDFNQGLDHRLLTKDIVKDLKSTRHHAKYRFAFDHPSYTKSVGRALSLLSEGGIGEYKCMWYVLVGFDTTLEEDLYRLNYLRDRKQLAYVMRYKDAPEYIPMARWASFPSRFFKSTFQEYMDGAESNNRFKKYYDAIEMGATA